MKTKSFYIKALTLIIVMLGGVSGASAVSPAYASTPHTDISAADSTRMYPEELKRSKIIKNSKVIFVNGDSLTRAKRDSVESMLQRFYVDQFRSVQDPEAPYFTFMSKDANLAMGIGAVVKMRGYFDWNGIVDGAGFNPYLMAIPKTPENKRILGASVAGTTIYFSIMGRHTPIGAYSAYIEGGFNGYKNSGFKLKKAWFSIGDFTAGLATTTFSDPSAQPDLLDGAGATGKISRTNVLVRYMHTFRNRWSVGASVEFPKSEFEADGVYVNKVKDYVPDFAALGQFQWNRGHSHVRVAGILRTMPYQDLVTNRTRHQTGWGAMLGTVVKGGRYLTFYGQTSIGQGIGGYTCDLSIGSYDLLPAPDKHGLMYSPTTFTATLGAKVNWMPALYTVVAVSTLRALTKDGSPADTYKYGQYLAANLIYDITERLQIGLEYEAGRRMNVDGAHANANRLQAVFTASF